MKKLSELLDTYIIEPLIDRYNFINNMLSLEAGHSYTTNIIPQGRWKFYVNKILYTVFKYIIDWRDKYASSLNINTPGRKCLAKFPDTHITTLTINQPPLIYLFLYLETNQNTAINTIFHGKLQFSGIITTSTVTEYTTGWRFVLI